MTPVDLNGIIDGLDVPDGYEVTLGGTSRMMSEGFEGLSVALILAILLVYMIMASQFESLLHPVTILLTMPLAIIGAVVGLYVTDNSLGITAMIGVIILVGIVVNNGIVLVDFINQLRQSGVELTEAIVEAGRTRLRPIFMTALTTILGLLPLAFKIGEGSEVQAPMAVTVIGGLLTSTVLTLVIIPVVYHLMASGSAPAADVAADMEIAPVPSPVTAAPPITAATPIVEEGAVKPAAMSEEEYAQMIRLMGKLVSATAGQ